MESCLEGLWSGSKVGVYKTQASPHLGLRDIEQAVGASSDAVRLSTNRMHVHT